MPKPHQLPRQIDREEWPGFFVAFSNGNRGRSIIVKVEDPSLGISRLDDGVPLLGVDYDPVGKGDDIVVSIGRESVDWTHTINAPVSVFELQDESGNVMQLIVVDKSSTTTRVILVD